MNNKLTGTENKLRVVAQKTTKNKERKPQKVTRIVRILSKDYVIKEDSNYINFAVDNNYAGNNVAAVTRIVRELPFKQYLVQRSPGASPGRSASPAFSQAKDYLITSLANKKQGINKKEAFDVASKVQQILTDINIYEHYSYINFSAACNMTDDAPVAQGLQQRSDEPRLNGHPSSNLGWSASVSIFNPKIFNKRGET